MTLEEENKKLKAKLKQVKGWLEKEHSKRSLLHILLSRRALKHGREVPCPICTFLEKNP